MRYILDTLSKNASYTVKWLQKAKSQKEARGEEVFEKPFLQDKIEYQTKKILSRKLHRRVKILVKKRVNTVYLIVRA